MLCTETNKNFDDQKITKYPIHYIWMNLQKCIVTIQDVVILNVYLIESKYFGIGNKKKIVTVKMVSSLKTVYVPPFSITFKWCPQTHSNFDVYNNDDKEL